MWMLRSVLLTWVVLYFVEVVEGHGGHVGDAIEPRNGHHGELCVCFIMIFSKV